LCEIVLIGTSCLADSENTTRAGHFQSGLHQLGFPYFCTHKKEKVKRLDHRF
jgi:hypothetical protein